MTANAATPQRSFDHLREHSIGLPQVLFQSITHMAPAAAVAYSLLLSVLNAGPALPLSVLLALIACVLAASSIGQLAREMPSAGGLYTYAARTLGPQAGFFVAWLFLLFEPLVAPFLFLEGGWAIRDVFQTEVGWHYTGQWWMWVVGLGAIVFLLTYRDIRISASAGVLLGAFEIAVFLALSIWMIVSHRHFLSGAAFSPHNAPSHWTGVFKGMVFAILAFIGFEASAPLGEEAKNPRRTIPLAVVGSAIAIGIFYLIASYAWVYGAGIHDFITQATATADPWRALAKIFWGGGWVLVFIAIVNSIIANSNAGFNAATRVFYAMARNGAAPAPLARTHPRFRTPHIAIIVNTAIAVGLSFILGWKWGPLNGFYMLAEAATVVVIVVYMLVMLGCARYYWQAGRFNVLLHGIFPLAGIVLFAFPLFYQFHPVPAAPVNYAVWWAVGWVGLGIVVTAFMWRTRPQALRNAQIIYVADEEAGEPAPTPA
jgi:amino acid transporter